ncbi:hypothetical protein M9H77_28241 [Catharanthus roseus]|uniref:Uncharacterized protein n=1 Tax=Catharanthus roseus TaxID=4058 RepID=A0ACC0AHH4_CATRO|nr:hypothetical protein M9H77_28241 [Catharanthus roseus]
MAMARLLAQTLTHHKSGITLPSRALAHHRHRSGKAQTAQIIELDLESSSSSSSSSSADSSDGLDVETINGAIKKLDEVIHSIIVRRATPDWLPFLPGYSFWIPPSGQNNPYRNGGLVEVIGRLSSVSRNDQNHSHDILSSDIMPADDAMPNRGWPSSSYFIEGGAPTYPFPVEVEVDVKIHNNSERVPTDGDEEG